MPRIVVMDDGVPHDVLDVVGFADGILRARTAYLFEIGEELKVRIEDGGAVSEAMARVKAHVGTGDARVTELEVVTG